MEHGTNPTKRWQLSVRDMLLAAFGVSISLGTLRVVLTTSAGPDGGALLWLGLLLLGLFTLGGTAGALIEQLRCGGTTAATKGFWVGGLIAIIAVVMGFLFLTVLFILSVVWDFLT